MFYRFQAAARWLTMEVCSFRLSISYPNALSRRKCLFAASACSHKGSTHLLRTRAFCAAAHSAAVSTGVRPHLTFYPNFTHWLHSINKLVSFATHLAGEFSNNIFIPFENMNHSHAEYKITSLPPLIKGTAR